jgi:mono/diheme cytochrome c family protein
VIPLHRKAWRIARCDRTTDTPFGVIITPNISPDLATGIGGMTDEQFYRLMHKDIGRRGDLLLPVNPFLWYASVSRDGVLAIKAYLLTLSPVPKPRPQSNLHATFNVCSALAVWRAVFFKPETFQPDESQSAEVNRGDYLDNRSSCNGLQGEGQPGMMTPPADNGAVLVKAPQNVLQVVLGGLKVRDRHSPMLAIGAGMTDQDMAQVANDVRQQWGNHAQLDGNQRALQLGHLSNMVYMQMQQALAALAEN